MVEARDFDALKTVIGRRACRSRARPSRSATWAPPRSLRQRAGRRAETIGRIAKGSSKPPPRKSRPKSARRPPPAKKARTAKPLSGESRGSPSRILAARPSTTVGLYCPQFSLLSLCFSPLCGRGCPKGGEAGHFTTPTRMSAFRLCSHMAQTRRPTGQYGRGLSKTIAVVCAGLSVTCLLPPLTAIRFWAVTTTMRSALEPRGQQERASRRPFVTGSAKHTECPSPAFGTLSPHAGGGNVTVVRGVRPGGASFVAAQQLAHRGVRTPG